MNASNDKRSIEQELGIYLAKLNNNEWSDFDFVIKEAELYAHKDVLFAKRLLQRALYLSKGDQNKKDAITSLNLQISLFLEDDDTDRDTKDPHLEQTVNGEPATAKNEQANRGKLVEYLKKPFTLIVLVPVLIFGLYLSLIASPRYESQAKLLVKQPDGLATMEPSLALLTGMVGGNSSADTELVKAYIYSNDMLTYLNENIGFSAHFSSNKFDFFSRLDANASREKQVTYLEQHIVSEIDSVSSIILVQSQAYEPYFAKLLTQTVASRAEWYINTISQNLAKAQLAFIQNEHELIEEKLQSAQNRLLTFQRQYNLLDPEAEGMALQQITFNLESQIALKNAELKALKSSMSNAAPLVMQATEELVSMQEQLLSERERLTNSGAINAKDSELGVNEILTKFSDYKIDLEFALQAYAASKISLEKSRIEAYRQLKYLVTVEAATLPEDAKYPRVWYSIILLFVSLIVMFGIGKMIIAISDELT